MLARLGFVASVLTERISTSRTWTSADGRPKIHMSSQATGARPGAHADYIDPANLLAFLEQAPDESFDCMLEAKQKDRALLRLREDLRTRGIVESALHGRRMIADKETSFRRQLRQSSTEISIARIKMHSCEKRRSRVSA